MTFDHGSIDTYFQKAGPPASRCWLTTAVGSSATSRPAYSLPCSIRSPWASTRPHNWCRTPSATTCSCWRPTQCTATGTARWRKNLFVPSFPLPGLNIPPFGLSLLDTKLQRRLVCRPVLRVGKTNPSSLRSWHALPPYTFINLQRDSTDRL